MAAARRPWLTREDEDLLPLPSVVCHWTDLHVAADEPVRRVPALTGLRPPDGSIEELFTDGGSGTVELDNGATGRVATWGVLRVGGPTWGAPVIVDRTQADWEGAEAATPLAGELTGLLWAFRLLAGFHPSRRPGRAAIWADNWGAVRALRGEVRCTSHPDLVAAARSAWEAAEASWHVQVRWVRGHAGHLGNEAADAAATAVWRAGRRGGALPLPGTPAAGAACGAVLPANNALSSMPGGSSAW